MLDDLRDRESFERLDAAFRAIDERSFGVDLEAHVTYAAATLLPLVVELTRCEDAWYGAFIEVVTCYLMTRGFDPATTRPLLEATVWGRFESWVAPAPAAVRDTCAAIGQALAQHTDDDPREVATVDALASWRIRRETAFRRLEAPASRPVDHDGHRAYIESVDHARDPARAERMAAALELARHSARGGLPLTLDQLSEWQAVVLGASRPIELRTTDAFAKRGRERYAATPDLREAFEAALGDATAPRLRPQFDIAVRAARVYLDVCFFHPFPDGNARAARLAFDHVLTAAGFAIHAPRPLFELSRLADDSDGACDFAHVVALLCGPLSA